MFLCFAAQWLWAKLRLIASSFAFRTSTGFIRHPPAGRSLTDDAPRSGGAFERLDAGAVADHFAYPAHVASDTGGEVSLHVAADRREWTAQLERLLGMYRAVGLASARVVHLRVDELSPGVARAGVRWALFDGAARPLYEFQAAYTLVRTGGTLRIATIAHDEIPRYRACLARLQPRREDGNRSPPGAA